MPAKVSTLLSCLLVGSALGARVKRSQTAREIQGVPVHVRSFAVLGTEEVKDWTIVMEEGTTSQDLEDFCMGQCAVFGNPSAGGVPFAEFHGSQAQLEGFLKGRTGKVWFIEPEVMENALPEEDIPDSFAESSLWGLERVGVAERSSRGEGVHIYVVDTGVLTTHTEFGGRAVATLATNMGRPVVCEAGDAACARDGNGHGTHCAATAAGAEHGVADKALVHGVKSVSDNGRGFQSWVVSALDWIGFNGARPAVASLSVQYNGESWSMETAVKSATRAGVTVVVAAGNVNNFACDFSPAYVPEAITVGATTLDDRKAQFSNLGSCVNIWAPGVGITSAVNEGDDAYATWDGTSMACPHVSGAAALMLSVNPSLTRDEILAGLNENGEKDVISGLYASDSNLLLSVRGLR